MTRSPKIVLLAGTALLVTVLLIAGFLRGQNKYPEPAALAAATPYKNTFFDPDPNHPWNQLYGLLFIRPAWNGQTYGLDELDPLYWESSRYLLEQPLHQKALTMLDQFIQNDSSLLIKTPLKRALLERMLWALFDTRASHSDYAAPDRRDFAVERRELQVRLVKIMKSVALTDDEIAALPDNYKLEVAAKSYPTEFDPNHVEQPFLPGTFFSGADWVDLNGTNYDLLALVHVKAVSGHSGFHVLISLPTGKKDTLAYLKLLHDFEPHWIYDWSKMGMVEVPFVMRSEPPWMNPELPQVPLLTKFALVRKAHLLNTKGELVTSPLTESVQIRVIRTILPRNSSGGEQSFFLFTLDQTKLMEGAGGLMAKGKYDAGFDMVFGGGGMDLLERHDFRDHSANGEFVRVKSCFSCHSEPGIFSMNSYIQFFQANRTLKPPDLHEGDDADWEAESWKKKQYDWGLLQAYWFAQ